MSEEGKTAEQERQKPDGVDDTIRHFKVGSFRLN